MDSSFYEELAAIFQAVVIYGSISFSFRGGPPVQVSQEAPQQQAGSFYTPQPQHPLARELQGTLYRECYARRLGSPDPAAAAPTSDASYAARLSQANKSQDRWDPGWHVYDLKGGGQVFVQKGERHRSAMPGEYASSNAPGMALQVGGVVSLHVVRESFQLQPGFYFAFGETLSDQFDDYSIVRFYFNTRSEGAPPLLERLTTGLNRYQVPFRFKCLTDPSWYTRTDAAVLYVARRYYHITAQIVAALHASLAALIRPEVPLFARVFRPGIGLAEDPGTGESFGMHRCRLLAEGIVDAWQQGLQTPEARLEAVRNRFVMNGMNLDAPYLNAASVDAFDLPETQALAV